MTLISCNKRCKHQFEGYCTLEDATYLSALNDAECLFLERDDAHIDNNIPAPKQSDSHF